MKDEAFRDGPAVARFKSELSLTGVYAIHCRTTGKVYVGSTEASFEQRFGQHITNLKCGVHHNKALQKDYDRFEHWQDSFDLVILEVTTPKECRAAEEKWIAFFRRAGVAYNYDPEAPMAQQRLPIWFKK